MGKFNQIFNSIVGLSESSVETLIIVKTISGMFWIKDSRENVIGRMNSLREAEEWCTENGYRFHHENF